MARTFDLQEWTKNKYVRKVLMLDKVKDKELLEDIESLDCHQQST